MADTLPVQAAPDPRVPKLEAFFQAYDCPTPYRAKTYVEAADEHGLDYRVMPALAVRESTCGMHQRMNNHWGWDSGKVGFKSVEDGIKYVAQQLGEGKYYRGKGLEEKLRTYNPVPGYVRSIMKLMRQVEKPADRAS